MSSGPHKLAQIRLANALALFDEFVHANVRNADAATLRGLEGRFAERLQIQPSYWSQIKGHTRQIGERLARQFEELCGKPAGWMDQPHGVDRSHGTGASGFPEPKPALAADSDMLHSLPQDDDERFIVGLVLTYYRRHPQRARARLLDLLGEVLAPAPAAAPAATTPPRRSGAGQAVAAAAPKDDGSDLWSRTQAAVAPLKQKR